MHISLMIAVQTGTYAKHPSFDISEDKAESVSCLLKTKIT